MHPDRISVVASERPPSTTSSYESTSPSQKFEATLKSMSKRAMRYEVQMKQIEAKLSENLGNFRAVEGVVNQSYSGIQQSALRAETALNDHIPHIMTELEDSYQALDGLSTTLPTIQTQVADVSIIYDSGRDKAKALVEDLTWLNTDFYERWRATIFTSSAPVSPRWKAFLRCLFATALGATLWLAWISLSGAYRAHRQRLVWGERLMS